jgi:hypothetical protein
MIGIYWMENVWKAVVVTLSEVLFRLPDIANVF